ncbi:MAG: helix-turn-helix transcriptional regulator [Gloeomargaritaceae cyanobacterium C42_A2020_066]|nr:helix-turn-helix transcriptional regulator [Gloeomargaritaceae cyanobacterium C42_A2020_066]
MDVQLLRRRIRTLPGLSPVQLEAVLTYIEAHLGEPLGIAALAAQANLSVYHFCRLFKHTTGVSPYQYILRQRVERAKALLPIATLSLATVALSCGFASQSHLTRHFRRATGSTPRAYRESHARGQNLTGVMENQH